MAGVWGCPPDIIFPPFLDRKGVRGMVERVFHRLARMTGTVKAFVRHYTSRFTAGLSDRSTGYSHAWWYHLWDCAV